MRQLNIPSVFLGTLLFAVAAMVALVALPLRALSQGIYLGHLVSYGLAGLADVLVLLAAGSVCSLRFSKLILRMGGNDAQWFWFSGKPPGLVALRAGRTMDAR